MKKKSAFVFIEHLKEISLGQIKKLDEEDPKFIIQSINFNHLSVKSQDLIFLTFSYKENQKRKTGIIYGEELNGSVLKWIQIEDSKKFNEEQFLFRISEIKNSQKTAFKEDYNL